ncbi:MAG: hypothetical protein JOS17DRAFT_820513 [Linnemannia elongata]|nr:MAG: hypothetical protein JOS17DRAFT_820513 [Linnemannia elongata]
MNNNQSQVQAVRPVNKDTLDTPTITPSPTVHFDCHSNPETGKGFLLWDDILLVFPDALYVRLETKVVPFMKDAEMMPLKPLRIAAVPDAVLDIVVDSPLVRLEAAIQQTTLADTPKDTTAQDTPKEDTTLNLTTSPVSNSPRRNPVYGLVEVAMENYSHIDHPDFRPKPRAPQFVPTAEQAAEQGEVANEATPNASNINAEPVNGNAKSTHNKSPNNAQIHRSPQDHTAVAAIKDISPIVVKASLGDARSQVELGDMYRTGDRIEQDFEVARHWYLKQLIKGDPAGQCNLGHLYRLETGSRTEPLDGIGLVGPMDYSAAMDWYLKAANQGHAYAQCCIRVLYDMGHGIRRDYDKAIEWYLRAADQDHPVAQLWIAYLYLVGRRVPQDATVALDWFSKAVRCKDTDVWSQIAMGYTSNSSAFSWFPKAALQGSPTAQSMVGRMYRSGKGVPQDYSEALSWLNKLSNHNDPDALREIGVMYLQGQGVPKSYLTAKEWFVKAVNFGCEEAVASLSEVLQLIDDDEEAVKATEKNKSTYSILKFW